MRKCINIHRWTDEEKEYLKQIVVGKSYIEIQQLLTDKFNYPFTIEQVKGALGRYNLKNGLNGRFEKNHVPYNKGIKGTIIPNRSSFKKGHRPVNYKPVGSERVDVEGYRQIKIADPNVWEYTHRLVWQKYNGDIQKGSVIMFADGNKSNVSIENLRLLSKREMLILNQHKLIKDDADLTDVGVNLTKLMIKTFDIKKGRKSNNE